LIGGRLASNARRSNWSVMWAGWYASPVLLGEDLARLDPLRAPLQAFLAPAVGAGYRVTGLDLGFCRTQRLGSDSDHRMALQLLYLIVLRALAFP
jgi:hypothetical protein